MTTLAPEPIPAKPWQLKMAAGLALLLIWELGVRWAAPAYVARPLGIAQVLWSVCQDPVFWHAVRGTLGAVLQGLLLSFVLGIGVGVLMGRKPDINDALSHYLNGLFATPMVAVLPLLTLWWGYNDAARLAAIVFAAFFPMAINAREGAANVPVEYTEVARSFRAPSLTLLFDIILPSSLPYILAGMRLAAGRALVASVVAEFFVAIPGLGHYILFHSRTFQHNQAFVAVLALLVTGVAIEGLTRWLTRRYVPWFRRH
jgi:ABC-type nitrate/sulfonate/bicarbonate transport system permease component